MCTLAIQEKVSVKEDLKRDVQNNNRYNNFDLIQLSFLKKLTNSDSLKNYVVDLFEYYGSNFLKIFSDYIIIPDSGNLILEYESDNSCNFDYRFEINLPHESVTLVATPKSIHSNSKTLNSYFTSNKDKSNITDKRETHAVKKSLLSLRFLKYLRSLFMYELALKLKNHYQMSDYYHKEGDKNKSEEFAVKTKESVDKIGQFEYLIDKTCLRHYGFEKSYKKLFENNLYYGN